MISGGFVALAVVEVEPLVRFYTSLLDLKPQLYRPNSYAEFHLSNLRLAIFRPRMTERQVFQGQGAMSLCLEVTDLAVVRERLQRLGIAAEPIIEEAHGQECYAYDPVGNRIIFYQPQFKSSTKK